jgi:hypothetical protein
MAVLPGQSTFAPILSHFCFFMFLAVYAAATPGHGDGSSAYIRFNQVRKTEIADLAPLDLPQRTPGEAADLACRSNNRSH